MTQSELNAFLARQATRHWTPDSMAHTATKTGVKLNLVIPSQIRGGKNNMVITRTGKRFPKRAWAEWRDTTVSQIKRQLPNNWVALSSPCLVDLIYVAGDKRRRDMPAIIDSIWHTLEKAGVVTDDTLLWVRHSERSYSKGQAWAQLILEVCDG